MSKTWFITGVSSGFGYEMTKQLLEKGDRVIGMVRNTDKIKGLMEQYPGTFDCRILDVTDVPALVKEVAQFGIGVTMVEPGGARTEFRYGSARIANLMPEYESCHGFLDMLDASKGLAPSDPARMAERIIESVEMEPAPLRMVLGSQALAATLKRLRERVADYETQTELAASTDFPMGE